jgi:hypothetical protein
LELVLGAYSSADPELSYFQGMSFPAAILLVYMDATRAFWAFWNIFQGTRHNHRDVFLNDFAGLKVLGAVWEVLLERRYPDIAAHFREVGVLVEFYAGNWFLPLFLDRKFPAVLTLRIFDRYAAFGMRALMSLGLAIIKMGKATFAVAEMTAIVPMLQKPEEAAWGKDWRAIIEKWDKRFISQSEYDKLVKDVEKK